MTQPPGQPPYDDYGAQQPPQPQQPYPGQYPPPPAPGQAPGQPGQPGYGGQPGQPGYGGQPGQPGQQPNPYATGPQQPYGAGGQPPYGAPGAPGAPGMPDYGAQYGGYPPPPSGGSNGGKIALIVVAAVAALAVLGGGIFLLTSGGDDEAVAKPGQSVSAQASEIESESPTEEPTDDATTTPDGGSIGGTDDDSTGTPPAKGVEGQWQDDEARTLTIREEELSGGEDGQHALSYIDLVGGKGILSGVGAYRDENSFRMALRPLASPDVADEDIIYGTARRDGDDVVITWDDGGTDTLSYVGKASS
ncbi:hypothetical protein Sipo8835_46200 [Streptomyces ipomoeae]|uniref:Uncharacterized protein n=2 Tax=Streptomyces ipomoeae TaxID=103232 RepID=A0AAE9AV36_9ACTN|nr:hypothetical protein [Streptomyces ipomoeae]TQE15184.1 hypothetical protein Sipo8835_46200 [Streptomyces ipomoeae]